MASIMGVPTKGPDFDKFADRYYWWIFLGVPLSIGLIIAAVWGISLLLIRRREQAKRRELVLTSRAKVLQTMVREAQEVSRELERYLEERLFALNALNMQVEDKEHLAALTPEQIKALDRALRLQFSGQRRSGYIQQVIFLLLAFVLGFIVNWLSGPTLNELQHWWSH